MLDRKLHRLVDGIHSLFIGTLSLYAQSHFLKSFEG
jgi:hypothetical protein